MSLVIGLFNMGWVDGFLLIWVKSWAFAFVVAFPAVLLVAPLVQKVVGKLVRAQA